MLRSTRFLSLLFLAACAGSDGKSTTDTVGSADGGSGDDGGGDDGGSGDDGGGDDGGDDTGDTGEEDTWRDDPRLTETDTLPPTLLTLVGPNWGADLAVDGEAVTVVGTATEGVVSIAWSTESHSGAVAVDAAWTATDIPLVPGDNTLIFTATDTLGHTDTEAMVVTANPGIPLASDLQLTVPLVEQGSTPTVSAAVHTSGTIDTIEVGPADASGVLTDVWGTLSDPDEDGRWSGVLTVPTDNVGSYSLRAVATVGATEGRTPAVDFEVAVPLSDAQLDAHDTTMAAVDAAMDAAGDDPVDQAEAAAIALLGIPEVEAVYLDPDGERVQYLQDGIAHVIYQPLDGSMGNSDATLEGTPGDDVAAGPPPPPVGPIPHLRARTLSSAGFAGPPPPTIATENGELIAVSPFSDHFTKWADTDGDGTDDIEIPIELGYFLPAIVADRELSCPSIGSVTRYGITDPREGDLSAIRDGLYAGFFNISSHGVVSDFHGPAGRGPRRGIVATRQGIALRDLSAEDQAQWRAGHLVRMKAHGEWVMGFDGAWIRAIRPADNPLDNTVVAVTACNSGTTAEPLASFMAAGAAGVWGYEGKIDTVDGLEADAAILAPFLERRELNSILSDVAEVYPKRGGRLVWLTDDDVYLGDLDRIQNGGFETVTAPSADPDHWTTISATGTDFDAHVATEYLSTLPTEGMNLLYMFTYDGDPSYNEIGQNVCPAPGRLMHLTFKWQVRTNEWASCGSTGVPNWINVRIQAPDIDSEVLWHKAWTDVCPMLTDTGEHSQKATGWQTAEVFFEAPDTVEFDDERLVFTVGGYNSSIWLGFFDDVALVPVDE